MTPWPLRVAWRVLGFELKGVASVALWVARRRHGVPPGATACSYAREQSTTLLLMVFAMAVETVVMDVLLSAFGVPAPVRLAVLVADAYGVVFGVGLAAACATRPHVVTAGELRVRYGPYVDLRLPRALIVSARISRTYDERRMVHMSDGRAAVSVASQTNVVVELSEPVVAVRPLGVRAEVTIVRFFADDPKALLAALRVPAATP
uniref:hypothetical protein n=1 Tax=Nonomuraea pusilla TaxID=46177 RepID=UPI0006E3A9EA|nr:hypothetical protein [Nonomuraea pusilla]